MLTTAACTLALTFSPPPSPMQELPGGIVSIQVTRAGDPPPAANMAAAECVVDLLYGGNGFVLMMLRESDAEIGDPRAVPPGSTWAAHQSELARREAEDPNYLRRETAAAAIRRSEFARAYGEAEPAFRAAIVREYARSLPFEDLMEAARFFGSPGGMRFNIMWNGSGNSPSRVRAMPEIGPLLAAARQRMERRIAAETADIPPPPRRRPRR
jgi:hypothetical protein